MTSHILRKSVGEAEDWKKSLNDVSLTAAYLCWISNLNGLSHSLRDLGRMLLLVLDTALASLTYEPFANNWSRESPLIQHEKSKINHPESL